MGFQFDVLFGRTVRYSCRRRACCVFIIVLTVFLAGLILYMGDQLRETARARPISENAKANKMSVETAHHEFSALSKDKLPNPKVLLPDFDTIANLNYSEASALYHRFIEDVQFHCEKRERLGNPGDGGWDICSTAAYLPLPPCLIYSFGINNDFSFDDDARQKLNCTIHSFDPSMGKGDHLHNEGVYFHNTGIAAYNGTNMKGWRLRTLQAIRSELNHIKTPIPILKMDIEGMEWEVIPEMLKSGALDDVQQFMLELHAMPVGLLHRTDPSHGRYKNGLKVLKLLHDSGFRAFFYSHNLGCLFTSVFGGAERCGCTEFYVVRVQ